MNKPQILRLPNGKDIELSLDNPLFADFERMPATFEQFISDPYYLGNSWTNPWPFWVEQGKKMFPLPLKSPYNSLILLGATGCGKTSFSVNMVIAYFLHIILCLRDPHKYFALEPQKKVVFAFINIVTKTIAYKNAWGMFHTALLKSPFFMEYGISTTGRRPEWICTKKPVELLFGRNGSDVIGLDIICAFLDEVSFAQNSNIKRQLEIAKEVFDACLERIQSRFTKFGGIFDGLIIMASSKRTDQAFAEVYAETLMKGKNGNKVFVVDKPRWEVLPKGTYCGKTFPVAIGDKLRPSEIITEALVSTYEKAGYRIIYPPIETYDEFSRDILTALTNIAGESVSAAGTFLAGEHIGACLDIAMVNPFRQGVITVGAKDAEMYQDYFDMSRVDPDDLAKPIYIHIDASLGTDGNCISGGNIQYAQDQKNQLLGLVVPELHYKQVFKIKIRAPKGDQTMLRKNTQFIFWLREQGFNIKLVTSDQYQSAQMGQDLTAGGIPYKYQSIDRVTNGVNQCYSVLRNTIYEHRIRLLSDEDQTNELLHLIKYENGVVDKPPGGTDDASQVLCGWVYAASQDKEEFVQNNVVLEQVFLGTTDAEQRIAEEGLLPKELVVNSAEFINEFGAYRTETMSGLRALFDQTTKKKDKDDDSAQKVSPFNFF